MPKRADGLEACRTCDEAQALGMLALQIPASVGIRTMESIETESPRVECRADSRREGDYWTLVHSTAKTVRVRDAKGMHYLARLLADPGASSMPWTWPVAARRRTVGLADESGMDRGCR